MFLRHLLRFVPGSPLGRALGHLQRGEFDAAVQLFETLIGGAPAADLAAYATEAYLEAGKQHAAAGDVAGAIARLERALELRPQYADVHLQLARLYETSDRPGAARAAYARALAINPRYFEAHLGLARLLVHLGEGAAALRQLQEAARTVPGSRAEELREIMTRLPNTGTPSQVAALQLDALCERLLAETPSALAAGIEAARAALRAGDSRLAIAAARRLLEQQPNYPDLHNLLGVAYEQEEMADDAIEEFERALALHPGYAEARLNLGLALVRRGREQEAARHLRLVDKQQPGNELVRTVLETLEAQAPSR